MRPAHHRLGDGHEINEAVVRLPLEPLRPLDALHLATADPLQDWPLVTGDQRLREAALHLGYPISDLPGDPSMAS